MTDNISNNYLEELKKLHQGSFGNSKKIDPMFKELLDNYNIKSILDFGCGKGEISVTIQKMYPGIEVIPYDPVTAPIDLPKKIDCIHSSDVLEHIEPEHLDNTLQDLFDRSTKWQYHLIACSPAKKKLSDGRNAHLIIKEPDWWINKIKTFTDWEIVKHQADERIVKLKKQERLRKTVRVVMRRVK